MTRPLLLDRLGVRIPVLLAPLAGGPSTPELAAAVSGAGGLGFLGAAYLEPAQLSATIRRTRALTDRPFGVNLFAGGWDAAAGGDAAPLLDLLRPLHAELGLPPPAAAPLPGDPFPAQLEVVLAERPAAFSFTFGLPEPDALARLRARGIATLGTATTVEEGRALAAAGVDAIVAQGREAGGHRGTFRGPPEAALVPTAELVEALAREAPIPVIASGGLMDGRDVAAVLRRGAVAAQLGTAFLACPESGAPAAYKQAVLDARRSGGGDPTVLTRAFSGRLARGLATSFIARVEGRPGAILPYPLQNALTRPLRAAAGRQGRADLLALWAGQGVERARALPAAELIARIAAELAAADAS